MSTQYFHQKIIQKGKENCQGKAKEYSLFTKFCLLKLVAVKGKSKVHIIVDIKIYLILLP